MAAGIRAQRTEEETTSDRQARAFQTLSNERRRLVVRELGDGDTIELRELSRRVAAAENGKRPADVTSEERRRAYNALQQVHLPKMDDAGMVEYDTNRGTIHPTTDLDDLQVYLEVVPDDDVPWSVYYLVVSVLTVSLLGASGLGVPPFGYLAPSVFSGAFVVLVLLSACVHVYGNRSMRLGD